MLDLILEHTEIMWNRTGRSAVASTNMKNLLAAVNPEGKAVPSADYNKTIEIFNYCTSKLGKRCILGNNSLLHTENNTDYNINRAITEMSTKGNNTYYQTHVMTKDAHKGFDFDNLQTAIDHAASWGAMMVELPMGWDCEKDKEIETKDKTTCTEADSKSALLKAGRDKLKANIK